MTHAHPQQASVSTVRFHALRSSHLTRQGKQVNHDEPRELTHRLGLCDAGICRVVNSLVSIESDFVRPLSERLSECAIGNQFVNALDKIPGLDVHVKSCQSKLKRSAKAKHRRVGRGIDDRTPLLERCPRTIRHVLWHSNHFGVRVDVANDNRATEVQRALGRRRLGFIGRNNDGLVAGIAFEERPPLLEVRLSWAVFKQIVEPAIFYTAVRAVVNEGSHE